MNIEGVPDRIRKPAGRFVRWMMRSGHRQALTRQLSPIVAQFGAVGLDVGGGRDSPLASAWSTTTRRIRLDLVAWTQPQVQGDACRLPIRTASVDAVLLSEVLEHLPEPAAAIDEIRRVLRPGGTLAGSVPFLGQGIHADPDDYFRFTDAALRHLMADFDDVVVVPHGNGLGVAWRILFGRWRFLAPLNPLMRQLSRAASARDAEGYVFTARR